MLHTCFTSTCSPAGNYRKWNFRELFLCHVSQTHLYLLYIKTLLLNTRPGWSLCPKTPSHFWKHVKQKSKTSRNLICDHPVTKLFFCGERRHLSLLHALIHQNNATLAQWGEVRGDIYRRARRTCCSVSSAGSSAAARLCSASYPVTAAVNRVSVAWAPPAGPETSR